MTKDYIGPILKMGQCNINTESGIRYGVISQNSVNLDCWAEAEADYGKPHCPECGGEVADSNKGKDYACVACEEVFWSDRCFPDEPLGYHYERDGYVLQDCLNTDILVLQSPYFTWAQFCSPGVPGAGDLDAPTNAGEGAKCYALGHDWFEGEVAPYKVYQVSDGAVVKPPRAADIKL